MRQLHVMSGRITISWPSQISIMLHSHLLIAPLVGLAFSLAAEAADFGAVPDPYTGNWSGTLATKSGDQDAHAIVIAAKNGFEVFFRESLNPRDELVAQGFGIQDGDRLVVHSDSNTVEGAIEDGQFSGSLSGMNAGSFVLEKIPFKPSETLGKKAPAGAVVLFDGMDISAWESRKVPDEAIRWIITDEGELEVVSFLDGKKAKQDLKTKEVFGDYHLHLEFNLFYKPAAKEQGRSNSGIFHHGVYETQILDSFGQYGAHNDCGGIYKQRQSDVNAGYPGGVWQTFDIDLKAPRFNANGKKTEDARMTVRLNGVMVHDNVTVVKGGKEPAEGPIILQDHGSPVRYRNVWIVRRGK